MSIVKSFSVGNGDMFYINHNSDNFTIIDCSIPEDDEFILKEIKRLSSAKNIARFISTHPDEDHIMGLTKLDDELGLLNFYVAKNNATKEEETPDFIRYCALRDSPKAFYIHKGCTRKWMNKSDEVRGSSGITILWPDTNNQYFKNALEVAENGGSPNNISSIIKYSVDGGVKILWMGDLETDFMKEIEGEVDIEDIDILFAPHHGRDSGKIPQSWLDVMTPKLIIIGEAPSKYLNYYNGYNIITQNSAYDITLECVEGKVHIYVLNKDYYVDFLTNENKSDNYGNYIGTLSL